MKVEIKGYRNLKNFEIEINENAVNLIMGMSGSGKSSIGGAILRKDLERNITLNYVGEQIVKIDGSTDFDSVICFNNETCESFLSKSSNDYYDIFVDDKETVEQARNNVLLKLRNLKVAIKEAETDYNHYLIITEDLAGKKLNKDGTLSKRSNLMVLKKDLYKTKGSKVLREISNVGLEKFSWMREGETYIKDKNCPYCGKPMSDDFMKDCHSMFDLECKPVGKLLTHIDDLQVDIDNVLAGIDSLEKRVVSMSKAVAEYREITERIDKIEDYDFKALRKIDISKDLKNYFESLCNVLNDFNNSLNEYRDTVMNANVATKNVLKNRTRLINNELEKMSIPYKVEAVLSKGIIESYTLSMVGDKERIDRRDSMSAGERNIFSLVLFIYKCIKSDKKLIIIDDPASYYDDYRKHEIYKLISEKLKDRTVLLMSHDSVYAKYMLSNHRQGNGSNAVYYIENAEKVVVKRVNKENFGIFEEFVKNRLTSVNDYYQKIVNLRILYEGKSKNCIYGYLSAIIHLVNKDDLLKHLQKINKTEEEIIEKIETETGVIIPKYEGSIVHKDLSDYSIFEKMFIAREQTSFSTLKEEMSESIHINRTLRVCLDPYNFNFCTKRLYCALSKFNEYSNK